MTQARRDGISTLAQPADERQPSADRLRQVCDHSPVLMWSAGPDQRCDWFNQTWLEFTGRRLEQELGFGWTDGVHPADLANCLRVYTEAFTSRQPFDMEYRLRRRDGEYCWVHDAGRPLFASSGAFAGYTGHCVDVTERKRLDQQWTELLVAERLAREEAERTNSLKDEFLASLSHELRTPLQAIVGWTQILRRAELPDKLSQGVESIDRNARLQTRLIEELLEMSRILSGDLLLDLRPVSLPAILEAALAAVRPAAAAKRQRLDVELDANVGPVPGDAARLQQVFYNLLSNAIKFTPAEGRIQVAMVRVNGHVEVSVTDSGIGIDPAFLPHVFDRFRQADASSARRYAGLGIGLSLVKHLVHLHGGRVRVKSPGLDRGATFSIELPVAQAASTHQHSGLPASAGVPGTVAPSLAGLTVLLVEDDDDSRAVIGLALSDAGAAVTTANSAAGALDAFDRDLPDVLVSDVGLPGEDGYALIRRVRARGGPARDVPAIALTAFARAEDRRSALQAGFHTHLVKPVTGTEICRTVASLARRNTAGLTTHDR